jgi:hypothetical protein
VIMKEVVAPLSSTVMISVLGFGELVVCIDGGWRFTHRWGRGCGGYGWVIDSCWVMGVVSIRGSKSVVVEGEC